LDDRKSILSESETLLNGLGRDEKVKLRKAEIYVKLMKKVIKEGDAFVAYEIDRVGKVLAGKVTPEKKTEMQERLNVLKSFDGEMKLEEESSEPKTEEDL
jgi:protein disulfide-isomerase A6